MNVSNQLNVLALQVRRLAAWCGTGRPCGKTRQTEGASSAIIEKHLCQQGFERIKNDDYYNASMGVYLEDFHDENIFLDEDKNLLFIDPVIHFEKLDLLRTGAMVNHFPF